MPSFRELADEAKKKWSADAHALYGRAAEMFEAEVNGE